MLLIIGKGQSIPNIGHLMESSAIAMWTRPATHGLNF